MRLLLVILIALLVAAFAGAFAISDTGIIVITVSDWTIQASLVFFIALLIVTFFLAYFLIRTLFHLLEMPSELKRRNKHRKQQLSEKYLTNGLRALVEGKWKVAEENLIKGTKYSGTPLINYLCAARAAQRQGKIDFRDYYLSLAHAEDADENLAIGLTQAELQINQQQTEQALATLTDLHEKNPGQKQVKLMLLKTYTELKSWKDVLAILPDVERAKLLPSENIMATKLEAYAGLLQDSGDSANKSVLENTWKRIPGKFRKELYLLEIYTKEKLRFADSSDCEPLLRKSIKKKWDTEIVRLYGLVQGKDAVKQLAFAESLITGHARDPVLLLTLGRLARRNSLWGKASTYLKESILIKPMPDSYRELAMLLEKQGDYSAASSYFQQGLTLATVLQKHDSALLLEQEEEDRAVTAGARQVV